ALLSHLGLSGAFAEFLSSMLLIALVVFAVMFIVRRLRGAGPRTATQGAYGAHSARQDGSGQSQQSMWRHAATPAPAQPAAAASAAAATAAAAPAAVAQPADGDTNNWYIPGDFNSTEFLAKAKEQFVKIQAI